MASCGGVNTVLISCSEGAENGAGILGVLNIVLHVMTIGIGILATIGVVIFGIQYMTSSGNEQQLMKAKNRIRNIVIGVVAYVLMYSVAEFLLPGGIFNNSNSGGSETVSTSQVSSQQAANTTINVDGTSNSTSNSNTPKESESASDSSGRSNNKQAQSTSKVKVALMTRPDGKATEIEVEKGKTMSQPSDPSLAGQKFNGWRTADGDEYDFSQPVSEDLDLYAQWYPMISYLMKERGKWIFINNPEDILEDGLANNGNLIYKDTVPTGVTEIYYEHGITYKDYFSYAIRFWNPNSNDVTLKINKCGASDASWNMRMVWEQYYDGCSIAGQTFIIPSRTTLTILHGDGKYIAIDGTDTASAGKFKGAAGETYSGVLDGVLNVSVSGGILDMAALAWTGDYADTFNATYNGNYTLSTSNPGRIYTRVYSGSYGMLPVVEESSTFYINDGTPAGNLTFGWKGNDGDEKKGQELITNSIGGRPLVENCGTEKLSDTFVSDIVNLRLPSQNGTMTIGMYDAYYDPRNIVVNNTTQGYNCQLYGWPWNWGNWAVRYKDEITIQNDSSRVRTLAFVTDVNSDATVGAVYNGKIQFGKGSKITIWRETLQPGEKKTFESIVFLGGSSGGTFPKTLTVD